MREQQFSAFLDKTRRLKHVLVGRGPSPELANLREASTRVAHAGAVVAAARGASVGRVVVLRCWAGGRRCCAVAATAESSTTDRVCGIMFVWRWKPNQ